MKISAEVLNNSNLTCNTEFRELLEFNHIRSFSDLWKQDGEAVKKKLAERATERVILKTPDGGTVETYIKRYLPLPAKEYFKAITSFRPFFPSGALHEWEAILAFHEAGIETMIPIAVAADENARSALLTLGIQDYRRASDIFAEYAENRTVENCALRRKLIYKIAELAGKMHASHFAHQDFYLVHLFVKDDFRVLPIDLQRIIMGSRFTKRWRVKDLGQLLYSSMKYNISKTDCMRFWKTYTEIAGKELFRDRSVIRAVIRKADAIYSRSVRKKKKAGRK